MTWHVTSDLDEFEDAAGDFLLTDPVWNTVLLTAVASLRVSGAGAYGDVPPQFGWFDDSVVQAAFLRTPPFPPIMSHAPVGAMESLVEVLGAVPGLRGPTEVMRAFADAWHATTGRKPKVASNRRLFRLAGLTPPQPMPPGRPRLAGSADRALLTEWFVAFAGDVGEPHAASGMARAVDRRLDNGDLLLWEIDDVPVSLAGITRPVGGVARVAPVYTPAALRGHGYAGAATAAISRRALDAGHQVVLFTDMANPTSNALYQRLGYRGIGEWAELDLA
jgi:hypothetical protein